MNPLALAALRYQFSQHVQPFRPLAGNMVITVYGLKNCDTCRMALSWLKSKDMDVHLHDVRVDGLPRPFIKTLIDTFGVETVVNRRSTTWRQLPDGDKQKLTIKRASDLLSAHPALMKRPVFDLGDQLIIGFSADTRTELERLI